jgi:mono/diheme cytochrome c family protein
MLHEHGLLRWQASCFPRVAERSPNRCRIRWSRKRTSNSRRRITLKNRGLSSFLSAIICAILWIVFAVFLHAQDAQFHNAPASSVHMKNPYAGQQTAAAAGSRLYATSCSSCHGTHGQGNGAMPALAQGPTQSASGGEVFWFITTGAPDKGMPSWSTLPERQRWQLVTYLKSLNNSHGAQESGSASK